MWQRSPDLSHAGARDGADWARAPERAAQPALPAAGRCREPACDPGDRGAKQLACLQVQDTSSSRILPQGAIVFPTADAELNLTLEDLQSVSLQHLVLLVQVCLC